MTRPVVSGNRNINTHLSEFISEILEPIAKEMNSGEVVSTEEALAKIDSLNQTIRANLDTPHSDVLAQLANKSDVRHTIYNCVPPDDIPAHKSESTQYGCPTELNNSFDSCDISTENILKELYNTNEQNGQNLKKEVDYGMNNLKIFEFTGKNEKIDDVPPTLKNFIDLEGTRQHVYGQFQQQKPKPLPGYPRHRKDTSANWR